MPLAWVSANERARETSCRAVIMTGFVAGAIFAVPQFASGRSSGLLA